MIKTKVIKSDDNLRPSCPKAVRPKQIKVHSPKIRLRLEEACDNAEKAHSSSVKYSLNPTKNDGLLNEKPFNASSNTYLGDPVMNRNKICQMDKLIFPSQQDRMFQEKQAPRCIGEESMEYWNRSRGSLVIVGSGKGRLEPENVHIRCPTNEAKDNLLKGRGLRMTNVLQHSRDFTENQPNQRIRNEEAAEISLKHRGNSVSALLHQTNVRHNSSIKQPRCPTAEALDTWKKHRGDSMSLVMGNKTSSDPSIRATSPKKHVKDEDGNPIDPHKSDGMSQVMNYSGGSAFSEQRYEPRVRLDGKEIAEKNRGTISSELFNFNKTEPMKPNAKVSKSSDLNSGFLTKQIFAKYGQYPKDPKPRARITRYSLKIAKQSQGGAMRDALCPPRMPHSKRKVHSAHK